MTTRTEMIKFAANQTTEALIRAAEMIAAKASPSKEECMTAACIEGVLSSRMNDAEFDALMARLDQIAEAA